MTLLGHYISIYSGIWWWGAGAIAWLGLCGFCYCALNLAGRADEDMGRK